MRCLRQERGADAVLDHADQHGGRHVLGSPLPGSHRLPEEVQPAAAARDHVETVRGISVFRSRVLADPEQSSSDLSELK